jgi:hypothetical protein
MTNREIAQTLSISQGTAKVYLSRLFGKLQVRDRFELAALVVRTMEPAPAEQTALPRPPINAQLLIDLFLPEARCEEFLGDLEERYHRKLPRLGHARADWWYRKQVAASLWPLLCGFLRRTSKSSFAHVLCFLLRLAGQASWADALKKTADEEKKRRRRI